MKWSEAFCNTFKALRQTIEPEVRKKVDMILPSMPMVDACRADEFDFFKPLLESGDLTVDQMQHTAQRYHLGKSRSGRCIYWMIDDMYQVLDGHIGDSWVSTSLKAREPLLEYWQVTHCLFGQHLLSHTDSTDKKGHTESTKSTEIKFSNPQILDKKDSCSENKAFCGFRDFCVTNKPVCVVESEQSAVILSELLPESVWMAYATLTNLTPDLLAPLQGRTVTIYPRTDPTQSTYLFFLDYADIVRHHYPTIQLHVEDILENEATDDQKQRCIDLLDFLMEQ